MQVYQNVASCFLKRDTNGNFMENGKGRYILLERNERMRKINVFLSQNTWLSSASQRMLKAFAEKAKDEDEVIAKRLSALNKNGMPQTPEETQIKSIADKLWAYKNFAYTMAWSKRKSDTSWYFAFGPKVFAMEGVPVTTPGTKKIVNRNFDTSYTKDELKMVRESEKRIINALLIDPAYQAGPGFNPQISEA